jgi:predicted unusual protein kinase regulating ubiquinone biosynthesis (AarF/ABC1/UbiB family)
MLQRALALFGLIGWAAWLYGRARYGRSDPTPSFTRFGRRFVAVAVRFRGGLIKLGQLASLRIDVMPDEVTRELATLQDRVPPHDFGEIERQIVSELGAGPEALFDRFEHEPIAAASLGQVHRAWRGGEALAVKVLYPGIERSVGVDLAMTRFALWLFNFVSVADLMRVYEEVKASIQGEMDYVREGQAAEEIARSLAADTEIGPHVRVPRIYWERTTRRVLTMEFVEGGKINEFGDGVEEKVLWATRAFLHMIFRDGFFHCDPHPGNLVVDEAGRVGILDFGMNKRLDPVVLTAIRKNVQASVARDADLYVESLLDASLIQASDAEAVRELAELSFDPRYYNLTPQEIMNLDFGAYFAEMRKHMKRIKSFQIPDGIVMWSRAFSLLYGLNAELAPGIRPLEVIGPYVLEFLQAQPA